MPILSARSLSLTPPTLGVWSSKAPFPLPPFPQTQAELAKGKGGDWLKLLKFMTRNISVTTSLTTIENPAYLIPAGTYTLGLHRWTKTGRLVPILKDVPGRTYILIHPGTREEHSKGCILIPPCPSTGKGDGGKGLVEALVTLIQNGLTTITIS